MATDDAPVGEAGRPGREDVLLLLRHEYLAADDARVRHPPHERDRDVHAPRAGAQHEDEGDHEHEERERDEDVDDPHDHGVEPAAPVAGDRSEHGADHEGISTASEADLEVDPAAVEQARPDVAPEVVGAEQVLRRRGLEDVEQVLLDRVPAT